MTQYKANNNNNMHFTKFELISFVSELFYNKIISSFAFHAIELELLESKMPINSIVIVL